MKKAIILLLTLLALVTLLCACECKHKTCSDATCTNSSICQECGQEISPALGHTEVIDVAVAPTCTETGLTEGRHCSICNTIIIAQETLKEKGHNTMHGICDSCGNFVGLLSKEWDVIREAGNDIAQLQSQISLQITLGGSLNVDKCNDLFAKMKIISNELEKHPNEFTDFSAHFSLLRNEWSKLVDKVNNTSSKSDRISAWKAFSSYYVTWQNEYFKISKQYYPPK